VTEKGLLEAAATWTHRGRTGIWRGSISSVQEHDVPRPRLLSVIAFIAVILSGVPWALSSAQQQQAGQQRRSADRPTALPENKALADQFAAAAAGYTTQVQILQAAGKDVAKLSQMANWLYFNAIDLSDVEFAKGRLSEHLQELSRLNLEVNRAAASADAKQMSRAANTFTARLNKRMEEGERLFARYEKVFNTVVENPDGSFTINAR
jgi:hypothetical protein